MSRVWTPAAAGLLLFCLSAACSPKGGREAAPCSAALEGFVLRAAGNEPFWNATISGAEVRFTHLTGTGVEERAWPCLSAEVGEGVATFRAASEGTTVKVVIRDLTCADTMADRDYPMTAVFAFDEEERVFHGCAWIQGEEPAEKP